MGEPRPPDSDGAGERGFSHQSGDPYYYLIPYFVQAAL